METDAEIIKWGADEIERLSYSISELEAQKVDYREEIKRLEKNLVAARLSNDHLRDRYVPCPDHRDKHKTGDECLMCQLERVLGKQTP